MAMGIGSIRLSCCAKGRGQVHYYHANHHGSITHLTNNSGTVANSYVYDSYGRRLSVFESVIQPFSYTGREYDEESGLYYYRARYFDATTGRFLSEDPLGFEAGDQNLYRYVVNNPINLNDPSGENPVIIQFVQGFITGAVGGLNPGGPITPAFQIGKAVGNTVRNIILSKGKREPDDGKGKFGSEKEGEPNKNQCS